MCTFPYLFVPGTIWSSLTLHRLPFNALLMSLGIVCLFECLANLAASVVYLIAQVGYPHYTQFKITG